MIKITSKNFSTNADMCDKDVLRYVESYSQYLSHIVHFFKEPLVDSEIRWAIYLIQRIDCFVKDCPPTKSVFLGRYQRAQTKLKKILDYENSRFLSSQAN